MFRLVLRHRLTEQDYKEKVCKCVRSITNPTLSFVTLSYYMRKLSVLEVLRKRHSDMTIFTYVLVLVPASSVD
jgi:hypothetical protein